LKRVFGKTTANMTIKQQIVIFLKGMAIGIVNVIPVSSGTVSLIIGVFERFINSIKSLNLKAFKLLFKGEFTEFAKKTDFKFFITLILGILAGMILTAISLKAIFKKYEVVAYAFFIGLIVASVVYVYKMIGKKTPKMIFLMIAAMAISFYLSIKSNPYPNDNFLYLILCGVVGSLGMIVPGISGSHLMMVMGNYELIVTQAIPEIARWSTFAHGMSILLPFVIGAIISIVTISYLLSWLMKEFRNETLSVLTGFMIGSLPVVYPWKEVLPGMYDYTFHLPTMNGEFVAAVIMAVVGASLVLVLSHYSKKKEERMMRRKQRKQQRQLKKQGL
jgi:putative membrane protein